MARTDNIRGFETELRENKGPPKTTLDDMSRQATTLAATLSAVLNDNNKQAIDGEAKAKPEVIKLGLDLHARQVTECRQLDGSTPKPAQKCDPWKLLDKVEEWVSAGIKVCSCYEAGACGYWYHRELIKPIFDTAKM